ncbi:putative alanine aminotransferase [Venturia nashicola]|uniref:alpha-galactosidase n=1 Tax=Venturia nashicola TaxID=86259 RepID=A0A4Z1NTD7_9PEZI|nr:putative alanine aminotransferase [Venturia nashicola]TLD24629.1 putative alanine aminotransferase [Venturia nashicola]
MPDQLWRPQVHSTWQIVLSDPIKLPPNASSISPNVEIFDIDLFENPKETIDTLHRLGKKAVAYFSAGSYEPERPDHKEFHSKDLGKKMDGWPKEKWVDLRSENVRRIMSRRIELAAQKGFDAIDPDNVDGYDNKNGLGLTKADSIDFIHFLAAKAHSLNLSIGLKNAGDIIPSVLSVVDFSVNEQCVQYKEADQFLPFIRAGKPVLHIEYPAELKSKAVKDICARTGHAKDAAVFSTIFKDMDLDGSIEFMDGTKAHTPTVS